MIEYACAGHHPALQRRGDGSVQNLPSESSLPAGLDTEASYVLNRHDLVPGDVLFLYTDGVTEARNRGGEEYGLDRLRDAAAAPRASAAAYAEAALEDLQRFARDAAQHDDITLLTVRF